MIKLYFFAVYFTVLCASKFDIELHRNWGLLPHEICGQVGSQRIIGGVEAPMNAFPWLARIGYTSLSSKNITFLCGGVLVSPKIVLTAAHCVVDLEEGMNVGVIRLGEHNTDTNPDCDEYFCADPVIDVHPSEIIIHKNYDTPPYKNDLALIRLERKVQFSSSVKPICLGDEEFTKKNFVGRISEVAGWGIYDIDNFITSKTLQVVKLPVVKIEECMEYFSDFTDIGPTQMCAGGVVGKDSCSGDSGGPLMIIDDGVNGPAYFVLGIVSFGPKECGKTDIPAVYTKMSSYMKWFLDNFVETTSDSEKIL